MADNDHPAKPLLDFVSSVSGDTFLKVEEDLGEGFVRLNVSEAERRQAKHDIQSTEDILIELLRNARDAGATHLYVASSLEDGSRRLTVIDDGQGVPSALQQQIFEPRVTSKLATMVVDDWGVHGRGMALYSISQNSELCRLIASGPDQGAALEVCADTRKLRERADQSTWPQVRARDGGFSVESGPRNLLRTALEFACQHPQLEVSFGSPAEIAATLRTAGLARVGAPGPDAADAAAADVAVAGAAGDVRLMPVWLWPAQAVDGAELFEAARALGLAISERNAYRVLRGEVAPVASLAQQMRRRTQADAKDASVDIYRDARGLKVDPADLRDFQVQVEHAFDELADKYYLTLSDDVKVQVTKRAISIRLPFMKEE
ncbi:MAG: sensor histidine kinase [Coriobacteriia bacterium]|nr:sensor histidine kinase [Coriobacteriia bacterium]